MLFYPAAQEGELIHTVIPDPPEWGGDACGVFLRRGRNGGEKDRTCSRIKK